MGEPATRDIVIVRADNVPFVWAMKFDPGGGQAIQITDLTGDVWELTISWLDNILRKSSSTGGLLIDTATGRVNWTPSDLDSRAIPGDGSATYALQRLAAAGQQRTVITGKITATGGLGE